MTALFRYPSKAQWSSPVIATLGNFDGVHLGHQALLARLQQLKLQSGPTATSLLITFYPHPAKVLGKAKVLPKLSGLHEEIKMLNHSLVDSVYLVHFTAEFSKLSAKEFVERILIKTLNVDILVIGPDARVGKGGEGTAELIRKILVDNGKSCEVISFCEESGERISSRKIREALQGGDVERSRAMLGRPYALRGRIVKGAGRGRTIGFPTANIRVLGKDKLIPKNGVYVCSVAVGGHRYLAVTNIGTRPTFESGSPISIESHLLDFPGTDIYEQTISLEFLHRLREEMKFSSVEALTRQIELDIKAARQKVS